MNIIYTYRDYSITPSRVFQCHAGSILKADDLLRIEGLNPIKLTCCIGAIVEFFNPALVNRNTLWTDPKTGISEFNYSSGVVLRSKVLDTLEECKNFIQENHMFLKPEIQIYLEFPGFVEANKKPDRMLFST